MILLSPFIVKNEYSNIYLSFQCKTYLNYRTYLCISLQLNKNILSCAVSIKSKSRLSYMRATSKDRNMSYLQNNQSIQEMTSILS